MLVIMETRCDPNKLRRTFELLGFDSVVANEVQGFAGGIVVAWQSDCISVDVCKKNFQYLHLKVKYTNGDRWYFTPTYASPIEMTRNLLWNDLQSIAQNMKDPWLVAGDFNDIVCAEEKKGGAAASGRKCKIFKTRIDACSLIDIGAMGPKFTWRGPKYHGGQRIYERLDRALCNGQWRLLFPDGYVKVLTRLEFSDHHPILISPKEVPHPSAPRQFKFESAWLLEEEYDSMLRQCWNSDSTVIENLTNAEREIKAWRFHSIDDVLYKKRELMARIKGTQRRLQTGPYNRGLKRLEQKLQGELSHILRKEELMWFQRSRAKWLKDGDRNTRYYHIKTINRRRMNNITMLKDDSGQWIEDVDQLRQLVNDFYKKLFTDECISRDWSQTEFSYPKLDQEVKEKLAAPISEEEVKSAVFHMSAWKAPGPDGFPAGFYQKSWEIVGGSVYRFVDNVWKNPSTIADVNHTDICLIPKMNNPEYVKQFRPISLCNTNYKIVSKVIVERLKESMAYLISPFQTGFVPGRNIHENIVVAKEMAHTMHHMKGRRGAFAIKVDLAKAYDKLSWEFIWRTLVEINFPDALINVIMHSVTSVMTNVKWYGARSELFKPQRGIRQGDPISPYLFVLCMDKRSHLILKEVEEKRWKGIKAGRNGPVVSHLMFADDLLLFGEASEQQIKCIKDTMQKFCIMSGQEISQDKTSILFSRNVERCMRNTILNISGFKETNDFGKYLGVPLNGRAPKRADFQYLLDQVSMKLSNWKAKHLSFAGRVTLAKSVIEAVPVYTFMSAKVPKSVLDDIERLQRQFIWGDTDQKRRHHAIGWEKLTVPKRMGGLGFRKLETMNKACLLKLVWKFLESNDDYWCRVLRGKYVVNGIQFGDNSKSNDSSLWKVLVELKPLLDRFSYWRVGDGRTIDAWNEAWIEEGLCLNQQVSIPPHLSGLKVCDLVDNDGKWNWNLITNWVPAVLQQKIAAILPPMEEYGCDERLGVGGSKYSFSVSSMYNNLCDFHGNESDSTWNMIWKLQVPERVRAFVWLLMHDRLLTNSTKSSMGLGHAMCNYCGDVVETAIHVMRDCPKAMQIWVTVVPANDRGSFLMGNVKNWVCFNLQNSVTWDRRGQWREYWAQACHCLWFWRNKDIHDEDFVRPTRPVQQVMKLLGDYMHAFNNNNVVLERTRSIRWIGWSPPKMNFVKLNTDGAYKENRAAGCGGVIRGCEGEWLGGYAKGVGLCSAFVAELWGVLEGLRYVHHIGFTMVELNIDSEAVVKVVKARQLGSSSGAALVKQIWRMLDMNWKVEISHTYREANKCADALANLGSTLDKELIFFDDCPSHIREICTADRLGITNPRLIPV
ncbi:ribonuclease H [Trifolium pratense]|uniref:Ribonuclease H n=2 Tax=Trifolium TaxID=3898 RepID=A0A2K3PAV4_TRIPR|nr:ribonuclease H [Trifolium pratense]